MKFILGSLLGTLTVLVGIGQSVFTTKNSVCVEIATPGYVGIDNEVALNCNGPGFDTAVLFLKETYPFVDFFHTYVIDQRGNTCQEVGDSAQDMLAYWYYRDRRPECIPAIITVGCQEASQYNKLAAPLNVLYLSSVGATPEISDRVQSPTWISTTAFPEPYYEKMYFQILKTYDWTNVLIVTDQTQINYYSYLSSRISPFLKKGLGLQIDTVSYSLEDGTFSPENLLRRFRLISRVMVYLGFEPEFRKILLMATQHNMTNGEYVFLVCQPMDHKVFSIFEWQKFDKDDEVVRSAYGSVLVLYMADLEKPPAVAERLLPEWLRRYWSGWNNTELHSPWLPAIPHLIASYAAMQMFGQVLNETLTDNIPKNLIDGTALAKRLLNRTFHTNVGDVTIDDLGIPTPSVSLQYFDNDTGHFKAFLRSSAYDGVYKWKTIAPVLWHDGNKLPSNEPECGFLGNKPSCSQQADWISVTLPAVITCLVLAVISLCTCGLTKHLHRVALRDPWWTLDVASLTQTQKDNTLSVHHKKN